MKQSKGLNGDLMPEYKKTTNKTSMGPTDDLDKLQPSTIDWKFISLPLYLFLFWSHCNEYKWTSTRQNQQ